MSPMLVYFLMMADDIKQMFGTISIIALLVLVVAWFARAVICEMDDNTTPKPILTATRWLPWIAGIAMGLATLTPGTKTIAAMVVLPKLTSPAALDAMGNEAKELYGLAKDALRNLAGDDKQAKADK